MTRKRFTLIKDTGTDECYCDNLYDNGTYIGAINGGSEMICYLLNEQHETIAYLKEVIDSRDNEISELGKQRNYLINENKVLQLKIKMLEQVKPIKDIPKSIEVRFLNE